MRSCHHYIRETNVSFSRYLSYELGECGALTNKYVEPVEPMSLFMSSLRVRTVALLTIKYVDVYTSRNGVVRHAGVVARVDG